MGVLEGPFHLMVARRGMHSLLSAKADSMREGIIRCIAYSKRE